MAIGSTRRPQHLPGSRSLRVFSVLISLLFILCLSPNVLALTHLWGPQSDVDKLWNGVDDGACWLATAANVLYYTGWNAPEHTDAVAIYDDLLADLYDGNTEWAWKGYQHYITKHHGLWAPDYYDWILFPSLDEIRNRLDRGEGIGLGLYRATPRFGHDITCWGYELDDQDTVTHLYITDSDDAVLSRNDARQREPYSSPTNFQGIWNADVYKAQIQAFSDESIGLYYHNKGLIPIASMNALAPKPPIAVYEFDERPIGWTGKEGEAVPTEDRSAWGHHEATAASWNELGYAAGISGSALEMGQGDWVDVPLDRPSDLANLTTNFTLEMWIKPQAGTLTGWGGIVTRCSEDYMSYGVNFVESMVWGGSRTNCISYHSNWDETWKQYDVAFSTNDSVQLDRWNHVVVVVTDRHVDFYINGRHDSGHDVLKNPEPLEGGNLNLGNDWAGIDNYYRGLLDNVSIYDRALGNRERDIFCDDFEDGSVEDRWHIVDEGTVDAPSDWQIKDGSLQQRSNTYAGSTKGSDPVKPGTYAVAEDTDSADMVLKISLGTFGDDDAIGVMFRYQDEDNYYRFSMDRQRDYYRLARRVNGIVTTLWERDEKYASNRRYDLMISALGDRLTACLDGESLFSVVDSSLVQGKIALYCWANEGATFDDVMVHRL